MIGPSLRSSPAASKRARSRGVATSRPMRVAKSASARRASPRRPVQRRMRATSPACSATSIGRASGPTTTSTPVIGPPSGGIGMTRTSSAGSVGSIRIGVSRRFRGSAPSTVIPCVPAKTRARTSGSRARAAVGGAPSRSTITAWPSRTRSCASPGEPPVRRLNSASETVRIGTSAKRPRSRGGRSASSASRAARVRSGLGSASCQRSIALAFSSRTKSRTEPCGLASRQTLNSASRSVGVPMWPSTSPVGIRISSGIITRSRSTTAPMPRHAAPTPIVPTWCAAARPSPIAVLCSVPSIVFVTTRHGPPGSRRTRSSSRAAARLFGTAWKLCSISCAVPPAIMRTIRCSDSCRPASSADFSRPRTRMPCVPRRPRNPATRACPLAAARPAAPRRISAWNRDDFATGVTARVPLPRSALPRPAVAAATSASTAPIARSMYSSSVPYAAPFTSCLTPIETAVASTELMTAAATTAEPPPVNGDSSAPTTNAVTIAAAFASMSVTESSAWRWISIAAFARWTAMSKPVSATARAPGERSARWSCLYCASRCLTSCSASAISPEVSHEPTAVSFLRSRLYLRRAASRTSAAVCGAPCSTRSTRSSWSRPLVSPSTACLSVSCGCSFCQSASALAMSSFDMPASVERSCGMSVPQPSIENLIFW